MNSKIKGKENNGITLIALVITIIVLLILAGVSIATLTGENGILARASTARENTIIGEEKEAVKVAYSGAKANNLGQVVTSTELKSELNRNGYNETTVTGSTILRVKFEKTGHIYMIKTNGEITMSSPSDIDPDKKIVEILWSRVALTESEKIVKIGVETEMFQEWKEIEILEEIPEINGVYKKYSNNGSYYIIDNNRDVYAWGENDWGQLGIGNTENQTDPVQITELSNITDIYYYSNGNSVIAKDSSGNLYAWGNNQDGELGIGNTEHQTSPVQITELSNITDIYIYEDSVIAKDSSGNLYAWGNNWYGQLGIGNKTTQLSPVQITGLSNITDIYYYYSGGYSVIAKDRSGNLYAWGYNEDGQLGIGNTENQTSPVQITGISNIVDVYSNGDSVIAKDSSGNLYAWGDNWCEQLGTGNTESQSSPVQITELSNITDIYYYSNGNSVIAKDSSGNLYAWGNNAYGQLGIGNTVDQTSPVQIAGISNITDIYCYSYGDSVIAKDNSGNLYAWGDNGYGQLGIGNTENQTSPVQITGLSNITDIYSNGESVIAKDRSGNLYAWGYNGYGQLGIENRESQSSPVCINNFIDNKNVENFGVLGKYKYEFYIVTSDGSSYLYMFEDNTPF